MMPRNSEPLAAKLADFAKGGFANDNNTDQLAVAGLVWSLQLLAKRVHPLDALAAVNSMLELAEPLSELDWSGLHELQQLLTRETKI